VAAGADEALGAPLPIMRPGRAVVGPVAHSDADRRHERDPDGSWTDGGEDVADAAVVDVAYTGLSAVGAVGEDDSIDTVDGIMQAGGVGQVAGHCRGRAGGPRPGEDANGVSRAGGGVGDVPADAAGSADEEDGERGHGLLSAVLVASVVFARSYHGPNIMVPRHSGLTWTPVRPSGR